MRILSKVALFGLAVAGLAWWLDRRRAARAQTSAAPEPISIGSFRTPSAIAQPELAELSSEDDLDGLEQDTDAELDDVGSTSRAFDDLERVYASDDGTLATIASDVFSVEEEEDGYIGAEAGESWFDALGVAAAEGGLAPEREALLVDGNER